MPIIVQLRKLHARPHLLIKGLMVALLALILTGCGGEVTEEIWLQRNERWKAELTFTLNANERELLESDMTESDLDELVEEAASQGISLDWDRHEEPDGGVSYNLRMSGQGWDQLNENCFDGQATVRQDDEGHIYISWNPSSMSYGLREFTLTIHGGEIISSNSNSTTDNSATWRNPSWVEVELTESGFPFAGILAIGGACTCLLGLLAAGGLGFFLLLRRQQSEVST